MAKILSFLGVDWRMQADGSARWIVADVPAEKRAEVGQALEKVNIRLYGEGHLAVEFRATRKSVLTKLKESLLKGIF